MNSRERVLASINHKEPDRVPIDLGGTPVTGISAIAYYNLKKHLEINSGNVRVYDLMQQLALPEKSILDLFKVDVLDIGRTFNTQDEDWYNIHVNGYDLQYPNWLRPIHNPDDSYDILHHDGTIIARMTKDALVFDQMYYPCMEDYPTTRSEFQKMINKNPWAAVTTPPFSNIGQKKFWKTLRKNAIILKEQSNKVLALNLGSTSFEFAHSFRKLDRFLIDLVRNRSKIERFLDFLQDFFLNSLSVICGYVGDLIDVIKIGDDLGENKGPFISPKLFREIFKPRITEICDYIKKNSSMKIFYHACGSIVPLIPDLIETGIDILNPVQISARDMDPKFLKDTFSDDITFWGGGVDTRNVINRKKPEEVKKHVLELLDIFFPGGGYVWSAIHNILPDVPPQNVVATFEAIEEFNNKL